MANRESDESPGGAVPAWVWDHLPGELRADLFREVAGWVVWLEENYEQWVSLPACWPLHEALRTELSMFWMWHRLVTSSMTSPAEGVRWHHEMRRAAQAWRAVADCTHEPGVRQQATLARARQERRERFLAEAIANPPASPHRRTT